jgi:hypothetical protein
MCGDGMDIRRADVAAMFNLAAGAPLAGLSWRPGPTVCGASLFLELMA